MTFGCLKFFSDHLLLSTYKLLERPSMSNLCPLPLTLDIFYIEFRIFCPLYCLLLTLLFQKYLLNLYNLNAICSFPLPKPFSLLGGHFTFNIFLLVYVCLILQWNWDFFLPPHILVHSGCYNKIIMTRWLLNSQNLLLAVPEDEVWDKGASMAG